MRAPVPTCGRATLVPKPTCGPHALCSDAASAHCTRGTHGRPQHPPHVWRDQVVSMAGAECRAIPQQLGHFRRSGRAHHYGGEVVQTQLLCHLGYTAWCILCRMNCQHVFRHGDACWNPLGGTWRNGRESLRAYQQTLGRHQQELAEGEDNHKQNCVRHDQNESRMVQVGKQWPCVLEATCVGVVERGAITCNIGNVS